MKCKETKGELYFYSGKESKNNTEGYFCDYCLDWTDIPCEVKNES